MIFLFCCGLNLNTAFGLFWRRAGQPAHLINSLIFDVWVVLGCVALAIAVTVPDLFGKDVPPRDKIRLGAVWSAMFILVVYLTPVRPDLSGLADLVRPVTGTSTTIRGDGTAPPPARRPADPHGNQGPTFSPAGSRRAGVFRACGVETCVLAAWTGI